MSKLILTDIDDTILHFADPFQDWAESKGLGGKGRLREGYKVEEWLGVSRQTALDLMTEFGRDDIAYLMRPEPDALEILPKLRAEGWRFVGITACGTCPRYSARRVQVIADVFGFPFEGIHYVEHRTSKRAILDSFKPAIWVEDNYEHAVTGSQVGHQTFLLDRAYNSGPNPDHAPLCRVKTWHDIYEKLHA